MKLRIYIDTSVLGGCEDNEFRDHSRGLLDAFVRGDYTLVLSELALRELATAPDAVRKAASMVPEAHIELVALSPEAEDLAEKYISEGAIGARMRADALHIALATVARVDVLVSWNFKHIVNLRRIHAYNAVNLKHSYPLLEIRSPRELLNNE
jgi:hypothetical protein